MSAELQARLTIFVNLVASQKNVNIINKFQTEELEHHTKYIEDFVDFICSGLGKQSQSGRTKQRISRGSYYERTKIIDPNEYDYLPILSITDNIEVCEVEAGCKLVGQGYGRVRVHSEQLQKRLECLHRDVLCKQDDGVYLRTEIRCSLHEEVDSYLKQCFSSKYKYLGKKNHDETQSHNYDIGQISLHHLVHGPSVTLRIGGPLCTTDIDLCFCIEKTPGRVLVPAYISSATCNQYNENHWTESVFQLQQGTGLQIPLRDGQHKHVFVTLKFISHLYAKIHWFLFKRCTPGGVISSYAYKLLMKHHFHSQRAPDYNIGRWLDDIVNFIYNRTRKRGDDPSDFRPFRDEDIHLPDINFPDRRVKVVNGVANKGELITLLWIHRHVENNNDTHWWKRLLDDKFPENVVMCPLNDGEERNEFDRTDEDELDSLLRAVQQVMTTISGKPKPVSWIHKNGAITRILYNEPEMLK